MRKHSFIKKRFTILFVIVFLICLPFVSFSARCPLNNTYDVYIYSFPELQSLKKVVEFFDNRGSTELKVTVYYLNSSENQKEFLKIINFLVMYGVKILPQTFCTPCELSHGSNWQDVYFRYSCPLLLLFQNKKLTAIVISRFDENTLEKALTYSGTQVKVFLRDGSVDSLDYNAKIQIENLFEERINPSINFFRVLSLIIMAACVDAVNPCEFFVLIVFLSLVSMRLGRGAILKFGLAYSVAIFIIYFMIGIGIWRLISYIHEAKIFVIILGLSLGFRSILNFAFGFFGLSIGLRETIGGFLNRKFKRIPEFLSKRLTECLRKFSENPLSAFLIGIITSTFLLPCTSGPYLIALALIADLKTKFQGILLLLLYNSIIITPFIAIVLSIYMLKLKTSKLKKWSSTKQRWLNLIGGLLMIALSIYLMAFAS